MRFATAIASSHFDALFVANGFTVFYERGDQGWGGLRAVKASGKEQRPGANEDIGYLIEESDDFLVRVEDFRNVTALDQPQRLDRIIWKDDGGEEHEYVVGLDGVEDVFSDMGALNTLYRIHTSKLAT